MSTHFPVEPAGGPPAANMFPAHTTGENDGAYHDMRSCSRGRSEDR
jgi:hypothetical protein